VPHLVFAIKAGETRKSAIKDSMRRLRHGGIVPMGVVLTHVSDKHGAEYGYGYGNYYGYHGDTATSDRPAGQTGSARNSGLADLGGPPNAGTSAARA
jgi:polysaccharide biosynthesis transport protein